MHYFSSVAVMVYLLWIIICTEEIVKVSMSIIDFLGFGSLNDGASGIFMIPVTFAWTGALAIVVLAVVVVICAIFSNVLDKSNE
ncbi:hypothetical protein ABKP09_19645 [Peribacillus frigoritolerans]|uniref:hypothetical protein n=1 Tax=Peribacillus frigoritolerans TaxID=450367 RepID=UPI0032B561CE